MIYLAFTMDRPIVVILACLIIGIVLAQSIFFLVRALKHAKRLGMDPKVIANTIKGSAIFTIAPALSILIGVVVLIGALGGYVLPWLRLSVIGALTYELTAASTVMEVLGWTTIQTGAQYVTIALVMTLGIIVGIVAVPFVCKPITKRMEKMKIKNSEWTELFVSAMFVGMISAFLGFIFADVKKGLTGWIPVFVMAISSVTMIIVGVIIKKTKWKALENYAIPISMVVSMICALPITNAILG
ncbi:MAG: DUF5058 family protein [Bacilli bacterium]|jgi:hypothetical protein|nr:DUF5058 family protein [Bacilli bacterium]